MRLCQATSHLHCLGRPGWILDGHVQVRHVLLRLFGGAAHGLMTALCHAAATEIKGSERLKKRGVRGL